MKGFREREKKRVLVGVSLWTKMLLSCRERKRRGKEGENAGREGGRESMTFLTLGLVVSPLKWLKRGLKFVVFVAFTKYIYNTDY